MDASTIRKMEQALRKILLLAEEGEGDAVPHHNSSSQTRAVTADLVFLTLLEHQSADTSPAVTQQVKDSSVHLPPIDRHQPSQAATMDRRSLAHQDQQSQQTLSRPELRDPFSDLKTAFEPPKEKMKTFNLKQIVTSRGNVLMNMLERLLETTEIDAHDVETDQTLLEYACTTGNMGLAKLCYRRGANLSGKTRKGNTPFNIVTESQRYDLMEFLHLYGVQVNSADAEGRTALHVATSNNDIDAICRLIEWGTDINLKDKKKRTPLHMASIGGHTKVTMLLLEIGADMNAKDEKEYTAVAHAEANDHFGLMDRLVLLGGKGHGLQQKGLASSKSMKNLGELPVSERMYKSSS